MKYERIKSLEAAKSRRLADVKKAIFKKITQLIREVEIKNKEE